MKGFTYMDESSWIILANVLSGIGMLLNLISVAMKTKRKMVIVQTFQNLFVTDGQLCLQGYAGAIQDGVAAVRNVFVLKGWDKKPVKVFFVLIAFVLGMVFNNSGLIGYLVVVVATIYAAAVVADQANEKTLKFIMLFSCVIWGLYDFSLQNYVKALGNLASLIMAIIYLLRHKEGKLWGKEESAEA